MSDFGEDIIMQPSVYQKESEKKETHLALSNRPGDGVTGRYRETIPILRRQAG
jgi:hypothetical protein